MRSQSTVSQSSHHAWRWRSVALAALFTFSLWLSPPLLHAQKIYWTDVGNDKIQRANLDGSAVQDLVTGLNFPFGIALNVAAGKMYWTDFSNGKIQRANLDGSSLQDIVTGLTSPRGIALDVPSAVCGNGVIEGVEQCDLGSALNGQPSVCCTA